MAEAGEALVPEIDRGVAPYLQVARRIRDEIRAGRLAEGERIPSVREISATWDIAPATATKVQAQLRSEGLVRMIPGVGTVVSTKETATAGADHLAATVSRGRVYAPGAKATVTSSELVDAPASIADALGISSGDPVVRRERVVDREGSRLSMSVSWLPGRHVEVAPLLLSVERIPQGSFAYLAQQLGLALTGGREQTSASGASGAHADALGVPVGSPVQLMRSWFFASAETVVEYGEAVHPADRWLTYDFSLD